MDPYDIVEFAAWSSALSIAVASVVLFLRLRKLSSRAFEYAMGVIYLGGALAAGGFMAATLVCMIFWGLHLGLDRLNPSPWPNRIVAVAIVAGTYFGIAVVFRHAHRRENVSFHQEPEQAADYGD